MDNMIFLTWQDVEQGIQELYDKINFKDIDFIIGIERGGLIPAVMLSHKTGINNQIPSKNILIVDDVIETGFTVKKYLKNEFITQNRQLAVLVNKMDKKTDIISSPTLDKMCQDKWIVFPWEDKDKATKDMEEYYVTSK